METIKTGETSPKKLPRLHGRWNDTSHKRCDDKLREFPFAPFVGHFQNNLDCICERLDHLRRLSHSYEIQYFALVEAIITQLAAMCVEYPRNPNNYTIQALLHRQKKDDLITPVDEMLNHVLCLDCDGNELTLRMCLKVLRNKFICHFDNFEDYDLSGNENVGDGKWTLADKEVLMRLLFSQGYIDELVTAISMVMKTEQKIVSEEFIDDTVKRAKEMVDESITVRVAEIDTARESVNA